VDDPLSVRMVERVGHLNRIAECLIERQETASEATVERDPLDVLHDEKVGAGLRPTSCSTQM
jgi:hypothetical protein